MYTSDKNHTVAYGVSVGGRVLDSSVHSLGEDPLMPNMPSNKSN